MGLYILESILHFLNITCKHLGSHNALKYTWFLDLFSRGPEDDLLRVETCRPDSILIFIVY